LLKRLAVWNLIFCKTIFGQSPRNANRESTQTLIDEVVMQRTSSPPVLSFLPATMFLFITGWGGMAVVVFTATPSVWPRWLFFFFSVLALTGTALPFVAFLNRRFPSTPPASPGTVLRQALWFGIYFPTLAWLQIGRVLTVAQAVLLAVALIFIEWLLRLRERSQWKP
jgi:hypothetical protein